MKWRCEWCGKPHEHNDPPCDNCGHHDFEKAVVPMAPESEDPEATSHVWVCTECGNDHPKHTPPCDRCGNADLERRELAYDEDEVLEEMLGEGATGGPTADVSYLEVLDAKLAAGFLAVGALVVVLALGFVGVVDVPGLDVGPPAELSAPGNDTAVGDLSLADVEAEYVRQLNDRRDAEGYDRLRVSEDVAFAAANANKQRVRAVSEDDPPEVDLRSQLSGACEGSVAASQYELPTDAMPGSSVTGYHSETAVAEALLDRGAAVGQQEFRDVESGVVGVDVHVAPSGRVYVTHFAC